MLISIGVPRAGASFGREIGVGLLPPVAVAASPPSPPPPPTDRECWDGRRAKIIQRAEHRDPTRGSHNRDTGRTSRCSRLRHFIRFVYLFISVSFFATTTIIVLKIRYFFFFNFYHLFVIYYTYIYHTPIIIIIRINSCVFLFSNFINTYIILCRYNIIIIVIISLITYPFCSQQQWLV